MNAPDGNGSKITWGHWFVAFDCAKTSFKEEAISDKSALSA